MSNETINVPVPALTAFMVDCSKAMGLPAEDAAITAEVLITADLWGVKSHGIAHLKMYYDRIQQGLQLPASCPEVVTETETTAVVDGNNGMGMVIGHHAMQMAIEKARQYGLGAVAVRNSSHYGVAGYYALMAVEAGMVGISFTNAHPSIAPTFGVQPMLGTNPIAVAAPTDEAFPFMFDAATSITPRGRVEVLARVGKPIPEGWVIRQDGTPATNSETLIADLAEETAALLPLGGMGELMGGYKGYSLATIVEIFSAAFQDGTYLSGLVDFDAEGKPQFLRIGHFFMAIDVAHFVPLPVFKKVAGGITRELRASRRAPDAARIYTAGEKEYESTQRVQQQGVPIPPKVRADLKHLAAVLGVSTGDTGL
jgi:L-2-hydroxycarboxylate dehydrogenase (NAD+)